MATKAKNDQTSKQVAHVAGVVLATLLALTAIVSAVVAPTAVAGRPLSPPEVDAAR